jgi:hypothetical protein
MVYHDGCLKVSDAVVSRSLSWFLAFLVLLGVLAVVGSWYLGPSLVGLAFDAERREAPYYVLSLVGRSEPADVDERFASDLAELFVAGGAELLWRGTTERVVKGRLQDEWLNAQLFAFPRGANFVELTTGGGYRDLLAAHEGASRLLLGSPTEPDRMARGRIWVLNLIAEDRQDRDAAGTDPMSSVIGDVADFGGGLVWDARVADLDDRWPWNRLVLLGFAQPLEAEVWLSDAGTRTELALSMERIRHRVTLLMRPADPI